MIERHVVPPVEASYIYQHLFHVQSVYFQRAPRHPVFISSDAHRGLALRLCRHHRV